MAIVTERWDGIAVDAEASGAATRGTYDAKAYGEGAWFWHPEAGVKFAVIPASDGGKATAGESAL